MKYLVLISLLMIGSFGDHKPVPFVADKIAKKMSIKQKKERFYFLIVPAVNKVYKELNQRYFKIVENIKNHENQEEIQRLKIAYKVKTDEALLKALKPHPRSITIAQAAMESAWATSRIFLEANNIFGMWSYNKNEPRITSLKKRKGNKTVWLKKFSTIEDSIRVYYKIIALGAAYKEFRELKMQTDDVFMLVEKLDKYSEIREEYVKSITQLIKHNKLTKFDLKD